MKKISGWLLIIFCSFLLFCFGVVLIATLFDLGFELSNTDKITMCFVYLIFIVLLILGLKTGIKRTKKELPIEIVHFPGTLHIKLSGQIDYKEYRNLIFGLSFKRRVFIYAIVITCLIIFSQLNRIDNGQDDSKFYLYIFIVILILAPILTLIQIKKTWSLTKLFHQSIDYTLTNESIHLKGETVESTLKWEHFVRIIETKNFFLLFQGKIVATLLSKNMFSDADANEFRRFVKSLNVKRD